ncbi:MAG: 2-dehydro-3-deoxygalactonokinase [Hyphomicrobiales bacterium]
MAAQQISEGELICVDWGSTNLRAFLLSADGTLIDAIFTNQGMMGIQQNAFEPILLHMLKNWPQLPIILSGMVGSLRGWRNTAYVTCPIDVKKLAVNLTHIEHNKSRNIAIIAGIENNNSASQYDVARGEETQLIGALKLVGQQLEPQAIFCLPGTHSKWMSVKDSKIDNITTHMTGEIFDILTKHSILATPNSGGNHKNGDRIFLKGLECAQQDGGLSHHIFSARTNMLKGVLAENDIETYLSGILIGSEIKEMLNLLPKCEHVYLVGNDQLNQTYSLALNHLGVNCALINGEKAAYTGMHAIAKQAKFI